MKDEYLDLRNKPTGYSYRVDTNVWAGEYPVWEWDMGVRQRQLKLYTDFGINTFIDLTEEGEMPPYSVLLPYNCRRHSFPLKNGGVPEDMSLVESVMRAISDALQENPETKIYIHCVGGVGRTGMLVACYYLYFHGMTADDAIVQMRKGFAYHGRSAWMHAPETAAQEEFIKKFASR